jgi:hypothetical protein
MGEKLLHDITKGIQYKHIDKKVYPIGMDQSVGKKPVPLFIHVNVVGIKFKPVKNITPIQSQE